MSDSSASYQVAIIGIYPPPIGGVSIHIKRLKRMLEEEDVARVVYDTMYDATKECDLPDVVPLRSFKTWLFKHFFDAKVSIIHYHGSSWKQRVALLLLKLRRKKIIFTFHSFRDEIDLWGPLRRLLVRFVLTFGDFFIAVSPEIRDKLVKFGAASSKTSVIPAFIPPKSNEDDFEIIPDYVWQFIQEHSPIIVANAFRLSFYKGQDLYGLDLCVELCVALKEDFPNVGFVFSLPDIGELQYFTLMQKVIDEKGVLDNFLFTYEEMEFYPILSKSDLFVRPTNTDGDSVSIREALHLGIPVVASDVVERPAGVVLFKTRDLDSFVHTARESLWESQRKTSTEAVLINWLEHRRNLLSIYSVIDEN